MRTTSAISTAGLLTAALAAGLVGAAPADAGRVGAPPAPVVAARAATAITLGQAGGTVAACTTTAVPAGVLLATEGAAPTYIAPTIGVLTSFTHVANSKPGQVRAIVLGPGATADRMLVVAKSPKQTVTVSKTNSFKIRLSIKAGQRLGLGYTVSNMGCAEVGMAGDVAKGSAPFDPDTTSDFVFTSTLPSGYRPNISAVLEPDVDGDGFGDLSQDACPQSALSQVACPAPDTTLTKQPKKHTRKTRIKLKFASTVAGSTFQCSRDGRRFKPCSSPYKRRLGPGHHKLLVRAVSPAGIKDKTPAKVKFTIRR